MISIKNCDWGRLEINLAKPYPNVIEENGWLSVEIERVPVWGDYRRFDSNSGEEGDYQRRLWEPSNPSRSSSSSSSSETNAAAGG